MAIDKITFSLRTRDPLVAKVRLIPAYAAPAEHLDAVRAGPKPLTHKKIVTPAGEVYRLQAREDENHFILMPEWLAGELHVALRFETRTDKLL